MRNGQTHHKVDGYRGGLWLGSPVPVEDATQDSPIEGAQIDPTHKLSRKPAGSLSGSSAFDNVEAGDVIQWQDGNITRRAVVLERTERCGRVCLIVQSPESKRGTKGLRRVYRNNYPVRWSQAEATASAVIQG